jgi:hypothetical protein
MNDQIYVKTLEIAGFASALKAMRLPMKSGDKSDSLIREHPIVEIITNKNDQLQTLYLNQYDITIGNKDLQLLQKLIRSGDEHAKVMRGIVVWAELSLPRYIWVDLDTYSVGVIPLCSESSNHVEAKGLKGDELVSFKENFKEGHIQKRIRAFSYQALRRMRFQRESHKLPIFREIICPWIESLPLSNELIMINPWWQDRINELENKN